MDRLIQRPNFDAARLRPPQSNARVIHLKHNGIPAEQTFMENAYARALHKAELQQAAFQLLLVDAFTQCEADDLCLPHWRDLRHRLGSLGVHVFWGALVGDGQSGSPQYANSYHLRELNASLSMSPT